MRKHIYLHSCNVGYTKYVQMDPNFKSVDEYAMNVIQNEYGMIKTPLLYIHFILGQVQVKECPWCGHEPIMRKEFPDSNDRIFDPTRRGLIYMECVNCGATGSKMNVSCEIEYDPRAMEYVEDIVRRRFNQRRAWDQDFVSPYEEKKDA